jgi:hypothetical protein
LWEVKDWSKKLGSSLILERVDEKGSDFGEMVRDDFERTDGGASILEGQVRGSG